MHPAPEISQHQTAEADPPADSGNEKVVMIVANRPLILTANEKVVPGLGSEMNQGHCSTSLLPRLLELVRYK
jgi:hypothetical protein